MKAGDEAAYRMFYDAYFDRLSRYLLVVTTGDDDAMREALQGTLKRVVRHIRVFSDEAVFWSWLTVLARSAQADERKKRRRYFAFLGRFAQHAEIESDAITEERVEDRLGNLLATGVASLRDEERQLVEWKYTEKRTVRDIAHQLGATEKAIEARLSRVRLKLREGILTALKDESSH